jgi:hypothetical protein
MFFIFMDSFHALKVSPTFWEHIPTFDKIGKWFLRADFWS